MGREEGTESSLNEAPRWYTADEIHKHLAEEHRIYASVDVANWIADGFQKAFEKGFQIGQQSLRDGQPGLVVELNTPG